MRGQGVKLRSGLKSMSRQYVDPTYHPQNYTDDPRTPRFTDIIHTDKDGSHVDSEAAAMLVRSVSSSDSVLI